VLVGDNDEMRQKSLTGKYPILETAEGHILFESTSIMKHLARQRRGFYGLNDYESISIILRLIQINL
jgi:glutathione S-transferase